MQQQFLKVRYIPAINQKHKSTATERAIYRKKKKQLVNINMTVRRH